MVSGGQKMQTIQALSIVGTTFFLFRSTITCINVGMLRTCQEHQCALVQNRCRPFHALIALKLILKVSSQQRVLFNELLSGHFIHWFSQFEFQQIKSTISGSFSPKPLSQRNLSTSTSNLPLVKVLTKMERPRLMTYGAI